MATGTFDTEYAGLNSLAETERYAALDPHGVPVGVIFQTYHLMVAVSGVLILLVALAFIAMRRDKLSSWKWLNKLLVIAPIIPLAAIECGWFTAELGRQPWVVYPSTSGPAGIELLTNEAYSMSVTAPELIITILLFALIYLLLFVAWLRVVTKFVKAGPGVSVGGLAPLVGDMDDAVLADAGSARVAKAGE